MIRLVFGRLGVNWEVEGQDIIVPAEQNLDRRARPGRRHPRDQRHALAGLPHRPDEHRHRRRHPVQRHRSSFHDWMYPSRMYFTDKLVGMGAQIVLCDPHRCIVQGPTRLFGEKMESPDIRAGMALVLAALSAEGKSTIRNVGQIDRGYERVDEKLRALGAQIEQQ